jgi:small subunit ribosomal protein S11
MLVKAKVHSIKKENLKIVPGVVHINATFNNTIVTITDSQGNAISCSSAGSTGFKGSRKGTPFAAQTASESATRKAVNFGLNSVKIKIKGEGPGRETAIRAVKNGGLVITEIIDITSVPHNGCRAPQKRSV